MFMSDLSQSVIVRKNGSTRRRKKKKYVDNWWPLIGRAKCVESSSGLMISYQPKRQPQQKSASPFIEQLVKNVLVFFFLSFCIPSFSHRFYFLQLLLSFFSNSPKNSQHTFFFGWSHLTRWRFVHKDISEFIAFCCFHNDFLISFCWPLAVVHFFFTLYNLLIRMVRLKLLLICFCFARFHLFCSHMKKKCANRCGCCYCCCCCYFRLSHCCR